ncbi:MAG TPA: oxygen-independent coproporphyrinogen III oxidase [Bacteroidia bacterium]
MDLISKYNVQVPRYTSYPTVPYWDNQVDMELWKEKVHTSFIESNQQAGISIYIHLPYCESLCTYCACNTRITVNHQVEAPYIAALIKEWNLYLAILKDKPRIKEIHLGGGTPTFFSPAHLKELIESILKTSEVCKGAEFSFEAHPGNTTIEHLKILYQFGFKRISFGIQDFDPKVQQAIHRIESFEQVKKVVEEARAVGYTSINFDLIYGLPFQTRKSVIDTINHVNLLRPDRIAFYSYAHVPWIKPGQRSFTEQDLPVDVEKRKLYEIGKEKFKENGYKEIGMDHFALPKESLSLALAHGTLHRNFMGYTHNYTKLLIGLGVSSISDSWTAFSQNVKTVEEYHDRINKGVLPVYKNHFLTEEDLILRQHILNIMCTYHTSWKEEQVGFLAEPLARLKEMEQDGLVIMDKLSIKVTARGKPFIRNICMCFDKRYWNKTTTAKVFSSSI